MLTVITVTVGSSDPDQKTIVHQGVSDPQFSELCCWSSLAMELWCVTQGRLRQLMRTEDPAGSSCLALASMLPVWPCL